MIDRNTQLVTDRLLLRKFSREDIAFVFSASRGAGFCDGMKWCPPETEEELLVPLDQNEAAWNAGTAFTWTIERKADREPVGRIALRSAGGGVWDIGFWTHPEHQNLGYMTEAARAVLKLGFEKLGARRIEAAHAAWNLASQRVLQKLGMTFVNHQPRGFRKNGEWVAEDLYALDFNTWRTLDPLSESGSAPG